MKPTPIILATAALAIGAWSLLNPTTQAAQKLLPFQGRLTDASGEAVGDGPKVVQFKIYDAPTGGTAVWNGEVQKLTVNGGLVSTLLGTKAVFPPEVDFNQALYLEITVDANADNQITAADPPLLPRQSILPAVFAVQAADAQKLAGNDWSAILTGGSNNPLTGTIRGDKLALGSIGQGQLADGSVRNEKILDGSITTGKIGGGAVRTSNILDGTVTSSKLAPVNKVVSGLSGNFATNAVNSFADVPNLSVIINTTGRPVLVLLLTTAWSDASLRITGVTGSSGRISFREDGTVVASHRIQAIGLGEINASYNFPELRIPVSIVYFGTPAAGSHLYKVQADVDNSSTTIGLNGCTLVAYEL